MIFKKSCCPRFPFCPSKNAKNLIQKAAEGKHFENHALGLHFGSLETSKGSILRVLGSLRAPFLVTFDGPEAPGHAPGGSLCSKGGQDRSWERFREPNGRPREPKCLLKSI